MFALSACRNNTITSKTEPLIALNSLNSPQASSANNCGKCSLLNGAQFRLSSALCDYI